MNSFRPKILVLDDEPDMVENLTRILHGHGYEVLAETDSLRALQLVERESPDLVLTDLRMPGVDGMGFLERLRARDAALPVIMLTGFASVDSAVDAMRSGATDYLAKPFTAPDLVLRVQRALDGNGRRRGLELPQAPVRADVDAEEIVGQSPALLEAIKLADKLAGARVPVLIVGEPGTGKELLARRIHRLSSGSEGTFSVVRCGAMVEAQLEELLFGRTRGSLGEWSPDSSGLLESALGGTVLLAEISETTLSFQAKLLRFIEDAALLRVGDATSGGWMRLILAGPRSLHRSVSDGCFREDLFNRLRGASIQLPPLRERQSDIAALASHWIRRCAQQMGMPVPTLHPGAVERLMLHSWPGNVTELRNVVERAIVMTETGEPVRADDLRFDAAEPFAESNVLADGVRDTERAKILMALQASDGNRTLAAKRLGIGRRTLYDKLVRLGISLQPEV